MMRFLRWPKPLTILSSAKQRLRPAAFSLADQCLAVGGVFLANVALARTQSKEEYGVFALSYSVFTLLAGLYNAAVLDPFTVYASGRYRLRLAPYLRLMLRGNVLTGLTLSVALLLACALFSRWAPSLSAPPLWGLALTITFILTGSFLRRCFYVTGRPALAARTSLLFCITVALLLAIAAKARELSGFRVFLILALGWIVASLAVIRQLPLAEREPPFLASEPHYWGEHWAYTRWMLAQAFIYQFMHQGYYWLVAGFLSVKEVGELKAMYVLIAPIEQVIISLAFLFLPALAARYAAQDKDAFVALWKKYSLLTLGITAVFALCVGVGGRRAIHILYAGKFDDLAPMLFLLALVPLTMGIGNTMSDALRAAERPRAVFYAYASSALATFAFGLPLVRYLGLRGAVYGMLVSAAAYSGALALVFRGNVDRRVAAASFEAFEQAPILPASEEVL